jgi:hypothetical protein
MSVLGRYYRHHVRSHGRFHLAVVLTIVAVSYVVVPAIVAFLGTASTYNPGGYEPKDFERGAWLARLKPVTGFAWDDVLKIGLFVLAGVAWLAVGPPGSPRRPSRR